jgi:hypothetical protein
MFSLSSESRDATLPSAVYRAGLRYIESATQHIAVPTEPKWGEYDQIYVETLRVHPNTGELGYVARKGQSQFVVHNHRASIGYDMVWFDSLRFTPDGSVLFYLAERDNRALFVVNGVQERVLEMVLEPQPLLVEAGTALGLYVITTSGNSLQSFYVFPYDQEKQDTLWNS